MQLIIFDLDGTLLYTIDDLGIACNYALAACGFPTHPVEEYSQFVGNGINQLLLQSLPQAEQSEQNILRLREFFIPYYNRHNAECTHPYTGIPDLLAHLQQSDCLLAVASNKYQSAAQYLIDRFFPHIFNLVLGERANAPRKPNPQIIYDICAQLHCPLNRVLYVGDSLVDITTAKNANIPVAACSWGFVARPLLVEANPTFLVDSPEQILTLQTPTTWQK